jgi:hypothetical protein
MNTTISKEWKRLSLGFRYGVGMYRYLQAKDEALADRRGIPE